MCQFKKRNNVRFTPQYIDLVLLLINQFFSLSLVYYFSIMKHLKLSLSNKNYYLLQRIAKADDRRLYDLIYLIFYVV